MGDRLFLGPRTERALLLYLAEKPAGLAHEIWQFFQILDMRGAAVKFYA